MTIRSFSHAFFFARPCLRRAPNRPSSFRRGSSRLSRFQFVYGLVLVSIVRSSCIPGVWWGLWEKRLFCMLFGVIVLNFGAMGECIY